MFKVGHAITSSGLWFCDVLRDGRIYCSVANMRTEEEALMRATKIADALNLATSQGVIDPEATAKVVG